MKAAREDGVDDARVWPGHLFYVFLEWRRAFQFQLGAYGAFYRLQTRLEALKVTLI